MKLFLYTKRQDINTYQFIAGIKSGGQLIYLEESLDIYEKSHFAERLFKYKNASSAALSVSFLNNLTKIFR